MRGFEKRPLRHEVTGGLKEMNNEDLHNLYCSPCIIRMAYIFLIFIVFVLHGDNAFEYKINCSVN